MLPECWRLRLTVECCLREVSKETLCGLLAGFKPQIKYSLKSYWLTVIQGAVDWMANRTIPDVQRVERRAERELQPQQRRLERRLDVRRCSQFSLD